MDEDDRITGLVTAAAAGDQGAWDQLIERFTPLAWWVARAHGLRGDEAADVVQTTWLRLLENLDRIRRPRSLGAWLATTTRRECLRVHRARQREVPTDTYPETRTHQLREASPEVVVLAKSHHELLEQQLAELSPRCQRLLGLLLADPPANYQQVSARLGMPIGSIGPTRARCLNCLRERLERIGVAA